MTTDATYTRCDSCSDTWFDGLSLERAIEKFSREGNANAVRILSKVKQVGECWEWQGSLNTSAYGQTSIKGKMIYAHRASYLFFCGAFDTSLCVLHKCDNRRCVNPAHLFLGTNADNTRDKVKKGRHIFGSAQVTSKITESIVSEARNRRRSGETVRGLAKSYGISPSQMFRVLSGEQWAHVANPIPAGGSQ